jgi:hypothetical protein
VISNAEFEHYLVTRVKRNLSRLSQAILFTGTSPNPNHISLSNTNDHSTVKILSFVTFYTIFRHLIHEILSESALLYILRMFYNLSKHEFHKTYSNNV